MRRREAASRALAATRASLHSYPSCTRRGMSRGNVIVAYIISTVIAMGAQSLRHSLIPLSRSLTSIRVQQYQLIWNYYCLYVACPGCCKYLYIPRTAPYSNVLEFIPSWHLATTISHEGSLQNTGPLENFLVKDGNLFKLLQEMDYYRLLSKIVSLQNSDLSPVDNMSLANITLHSSKKTSDSVRTIDVKTKSIKTSSGKVGAISDINYKSGRRTDEVNSATRAKGDIQPSVFLENLTIRLPNTIDNLPNTWSVSTINSSLAEVTKKSIPDVNNYESIQLKKSIDHSPKSNGSTDNTYLSNNETRRHLLFRQFRTQLDQVERKFLLSVFKKLTAISPEDRKENGISFLQSGFFLYQLLLSLSITLDRNVAQEIEQFLGSNMPESDKIEILERTVKWLPKSSDVLKFRWSSRLVLRRQDGDGIRAAAARAPLLLSWLDGNETAADLTQTLNNMVLSDSEGSMHDTFDEEEVAGGVCAAVLGTACVRGAWRAAPTLLNDSLPFRDAPAAPNRTSRFFRLNDIMAYSHLHEWDAEAIEISYATPGLTLLILVPKEPSLRPLVERVATIGLDHVVGFMRPMRLAVTLPLYTLRMTLLLPNKLEDMGMPSLLTNGSNCPSDVPVKLSHAVQRLMFWAEAGRNAFKDDGIEWDPRPELEIVLDRPYLFFVRWHNITIMNGVFAL